jgi:UDP-glucose 4-epimerase
MCRTWVEALSHWHPNRRESLKVEHRRSDPRNPKRVVVVGSRGFVGADLCTRLATEVVYISSDAVYAEEVNPVREDSCCQPSGYHGLMHATREAMLRNTCGAAGIPLFVLRPSLLYGAQDTHNGYGPNRFIRLASSGEGIKLFGNGEEQRDHVYIGDLSTLACAGIVRSSAGVLNVATGDSHSFHSVASLAIGQFDGSSQIETQPRSNPITHRHFDVTVVHRAFPEFSITGLEAGLQRMAAELDD